MNTDILNNTKITCYNTIQAWCLEKQYPQEICWLLRCQKYIIAILMIRKRYNEIG